MVMCFSPFLGLGFVLVFLFLTSLQRRRDDATRKQKKRYYQQGKSESSKGEFDNWRITSLEESQRKRYSAGEDG